MEILTKLENVYKVIRSLTHVIEQHIRNDIGESKRHKSACSIKRLKPPTFKGVVNPSIVESWIMQIEKIFDVLRCAEDQKIPFATFIFEGEAEHWWRMMKRILLERKEEPLTWDVFLEAFYDKYSPKSVYDQETEFLELV